MLKSAFARLISADSLRWLAGLIALFSFCFSHATAVTLEWDNNPEPVGGYYLYYGQNSENYTTQIDVGNQTTYSPTGLQEGSTYYFAVTAYDITQTLESDFSNEIIHTIGTPVSLIADFNGSPTAGVAPLAVSFTDTSTGEITSWAWDFGDGATSTEQNPSHTYTSEGTYTVSLTTTGPGGSDFKTLVDYITVTSNSSGQITMAWAPSPDPAVGGYYLSYGQSSGNYTSQVDVGNQTMYTLSGLVEGATYYLAVRAYDINRTIESDFTNEVSHTVGTPISLNADFSASPISGMAPLSINFTDQSTGSNITSWFWDFGDGDTSSVENPFKTYTEPGEYEVILTVTDAGGGEDTLIKSGYILVLPPPPEAGFSANPISGTAPLEVAFSDQSTGEATGWVWDFGDGSTSTVQNPSHTYLAAGAYTVTLTTSGPGGSDSETKSNRIIVTSSSTGGGTSQEGLVAAYGFEEVSGSGVTDSSAEGNHGIISGASRISQGIVGKALSFDGIDDWVTTDHTPSLDLSTGMTLEAWIYPENRTGYKTVIMKELPGFLDYLLGIQNTGEPFGNIYVDDDLYPPGSAEVSDTEVIPLNTWTHIATTFDGTMHKLYVNGIEVGATEVIESIISSSGPLRIGGNSIWDSNFFQGYIDEVRVYNRALTGSEIETDMFTPVVDENAPAAPEAIISAAPTSGDAPLEVAFVDHSTGEIDSRLWNFGDGTESTSTAPSKVYNAPGTYTATLTVSGPGGNDNVTQIITVTEAPPPPEAPVADFTADQISDTPPLMVHFADQSTGQVDSWLWNFGNGSDSSGSEATITYDEPGDYTVSLTVSGPGGNDTAIQTIIVTDATPPPAAPTADFSADPISGVAPLEVNFEDLSSGLISSWLWDFGNGLESGAINPATTYSTPGNYLVSLTVTGPGGDDTITQPITVTEAPLEEALLETGEIVVDGNGACIEFRHLFTDPVVVAKPASLNDPRPAVVRISEVDSEGFCLWMQEWDYLAGDTPHGPETVAYLVVERGNHILEDGTMIEAGRSEVFDEIFKRVNFEQPFPSIPVIIASVTTVNEQDAVTVRMKRITTENFRVQMQEQESNANVHATEMVSYIAWEASSGIVDGVNFEIGFTEKVVTHNVHTIFFQQPVVNSLPFFLADMQTQSSRDTANLRWQNMDEYSVDIQVIEEQSKDSETNHSAAEQVGYMCFAPALTP